MNPSEIAERAARNRELAEHAAMEIARLEPAETCGAAAHKWEKKVDIILRAIEESRGQPWIPVEEKLPEPNQTVVGRRDDGHMRVLEFCYDGVGGGENAPPDAGDWWWCEPYGDGEIDEFAYDLDNLDSGDGPPNITHWMPLPDPPKGNENV